MYVYMDWRGGLNFLWCKTGPKIPVFSPQIGWNSRPKELCLQNRYWQCMTCYLGCCCAIHGDSAFDIWWHHSNCKFWSADKLTGKHILISDRFSLSTAVQECLWSHLTHACPEYNSERLRLVKDVTTCVSQLYVHICACVCHLTLVCFQGGSVIQR